MDTPTKELLSAFNDFMCILISTEKVGKMEVAPTKTELFEKKDFLTLDQCEEIENLMNFFGAIRGEIPGYTIPSETGPEAKEVDWKSIVKEQGHSSSFNADVLAIVRNHLALRYASTEAVLTLYRGFPDIREAMNEINVFLNDLANAKTVKKRFPSLGNTARRLADHSLSELVNKFICPTLAELEKCLERILTCKSRPTLAEQEVRLDATYYLVSDEGKIKIRSPKNVQLFRGLKILTRAGECYTKTETDQIFVRLGKRKIGKNESAHQNCQKYLKYLFKTVNRQSGLRVALDFRVVEELASTQELKNAEASHSIEQMQQNS